MKNIWVKIILTFIGLFVISCNKEENNELLSCDPTINEWAHVNIKSLQNITRVEIAQLPIAKQQAAWRTFSADRKLELWKDKYAEMMQMRWTKEERDHLELLVDALTIELFQEPASIEIINRQNISKQFFESWIYFAYQELHWNQDLLYSIGLRLDNPVVNNRLSETNSFYFSDFNSSSPKDETKAICSCSQEDPWCGGLDMLECREPCAGDKKPGGCGWLWQYECDGTCYPKPDPDSGY